MSQLSTHFRLRAIATVLAACAGLLSACSELDPESESLEGRYTDSAGQDPADIHWCYGDDDCPKGTICNADIVCNPDPACPACTVCTGECVLPACELDECGPAPGMPNWLCEDGTIGGPVCERGEGGECGWQIHQCDEACSVDDCGPAPDAPNWECPDGSVGGPVCERNDAGECGWWMHDCPLTEIDADVE